MTPAINAAKKANISFAVHEYQHDPDTTAFGMEAAQKLGMPPERIFKTLLTKLDGKQLLVGVVPVSGELDLKALAKAAGGKKIEMAPVAEAERATGYIAGGISPLGQKKRLPLFLDVSAEAFDTIYVSAGRRGLEIELGSADLCRLTGGRLAPIARC